MGVLSMKINSSPLLLKEVQEEFSKRYPFLKIEYVKKAGDGSRVNMTVMPKPAARSGPADEEADPTHSGARQLLWDEFGVSGDMTVTELEVLLQYQFGLPLQIMRKSGNLWMETRMTRHWTIRQQNEHGADLASG